MDPENIERTDLAQHEFDALLSMFEEDDEEVLACGLENPDICDSCQ